MSVSAMGAAFDAAALLQGNSKDTGQKEDAVFQLLPLTGDSDEIASTAKTSQLGVSGAEAAVLFGQQEPDENSYRMNTNHGYKDVDLDVYFSDEPKVYQNLMDVPLLFPSADNIAALQEHLSERFKQMLQAYNIPEAPEKVSYDQSGNMLLPHDYKYKDELEAALEENPGVAREMSTLNALTSHYVELQKLIPFHEEYAAASTQADIDAVIAKYSHLLWGNRRNSFIELVFSKEGDIGMNADGKAVELA